MRVFALVKAVPRKNSTSGSFHLSFTVAHVAYKQASWKYSFWASYIVLWATFVFAKNNSTTLFFFFWRGCLLVFLDVSAILSNFQMLVRKTFSPWKNMNIAFLHISWCFLPLFECWTVVCHTTNWPLTTQQSYHTMLPSILVSLITSSAALFDNKVSKVDPFSRLFVWLILVPISAASGDWSGRQLVQHQPLGLAIGMAIQGHVCSFGKLWSLFSSIKGTDAKFLWWRVPYS